MKLNKPVLFKAGLNNRRPLKNESLTEGCDEVAILALALGPDRRGGAAAILLSGITEGQVLRGAQDLHSLIHRLTHT